MADDSQLEQVRRLVTTAAWRTLPLAVFKVAYREKHGHGHWKVRVAHCLDGRIEELRSFDFDTSMEGPGLVGRLQHVALFTRRCIPVAWDHGEVVTWKTMLHDRTFGRELSRVETDFAFALRPRGRWLTPSAWVAKRTGKILTPIQTAKLCKRDPEPDPMKLLVDLVYHLPTRPGFPVQSSWTAPATCDYQDALTF